jgi:hypothetical protein
VWTYVDDLEALLDKFVGLIGEVVLYAVLGGSVGLVNVNSACWAAELAVYIADVGGRAADCVVEDQNARCSSAAEGG